MRFIRKLSSFNIIFYCTWMFFPLLRAHLFFLSWTFGYKKKRTKFPRIWKMFLPFVLFCKILHQTTQEFLIKKLSSSLFELYIQSFASSHGWGWRAQNFCQLNGFDGANWKIPDVTQWKVRRTASQGLSGMWMLKRLFYFIITSRATSAAQKMFLFGAEQMLEFKNSWNSF